MFNDVSSLKAFKDSLAFQAEKNTTFHKVLFGKVAYEA